MPTKMDNIAFCRFGWVNIYGVKISFLYLDPSWLIWRDLLMKLFLFSNWQVENVKQRCLPNALNYPMLEEYDFRNDTVS